jgi:DNA-repair protein complementing XP-A cells
MSAVPHEDEDAIFDDDGDIAAAADVGVEIKTEADESALSRGQKERMERNRMKAVNLKRSRLMAKKAAKKPYEKVTGNEDKSVLGRGRKEEKRLIDTKNGFFIEEADSEDEAEEAKKKVTSLPAPILKPDQPECEECGDDIADSYLLRTFDLDVCDGCRETEKDGKHELITKTDIKNTFLLKDSDLEKRGEKPLKFVLRKNPHNPRWGDMSLYLRSQVRKNVSHLCNSVTSRKSFCSLCIFMKFKTVYFVFLD